MVYLLLKEDAVFWAMRVNYEQEIYYENQKSDHIIYDIIACYIDS